MVQGTGSSVGKSLIATALCRIALKDGYRVAPFKAQNMSLNSYVTLDGAEIGRAQVVQAEAAGVEPAAEMNPILLKPEADHRSQLVVKGRPRGHIESRNFNQRKADLWDTVTESLDSLREDFDLVVIEGAGSPAEINLRQGDIVNMEVALYAQSPVVLVGDIDKGGVFASLYGTMMLLSQPERELVCGTVINKFRGDVEILKPGLSQLEELTGVPVLGVVPYFWDIYVPEEDSPSERRTTVDPEALLDVAVIALPHISNFDDFDPLSRERGVGVRYVRTLGELGTPDLVVIPGTKSTMADLRFLREQGLAEGVVALKADGAAVVGICGGYQMLGTTLRDPKLVESTVPEEEGLRLLPVVTEFAEGKETHQVTGTVVADVGLLAGARGVAVEGYEIHMGSSVPKDGPMHGPVLKLTRKTAATEEVDDGHISQDGWVLGAYVHGLFHNDDLRRTVLRNLATRKGVSMPLADDVFSQSAEYDKLADLVRSSLDLEAVYKAARL